MSGRKEKDMPHSFFHALMNPRSIAIVGASNNPMKMGTMHALSILKDGYTGKLYPVHPTEKTVLGLPACASPSDLPEVPDLAMFVLPSKHLLPVFEAFGRLGTKHAIVITAGFKETGTDGADQEMQLRAVARKYGVRFVGPNCMGIVNRDIGLNTSVSPITGPPGKLGLISQSGTYVAQTVDYLQKRGIRLGKAVSVGNEADISIVDVLEYMGDDPQTAAIAIYIESVRDARRFLDVARRITPQKPVVAQYIGGSEAGGRAGRSHTGAMAGKSYLYDGLFRQAGIFQVDSIEDLYGQGWALANQPQIHGRRIGIITNSGGPGSAIADTLDSCGCEVPPFSEALQKQIRPLIPPHAPCGNPVDLTFSMDMQVMSETIPELIMKSGEVDGVVLHGAMSTGFYRLVYPHMAELMGDTSLEDFMAATRKDLTPSVSLPFELNMPLIVSSFFDRDDEYTKAYEDRGVPVFDSPEKAARAVAALLRYKEVRDREPYLPPDQPGKNPKAETIIRQALVEGKSALDEYEAKQLLAVYGIPVCAERRVQSREAAVAAAVEIGFPVVVKACDASFLHKTDRGLVHINVTDDDGVATAFDALQAAAGRKVPVLIAEMIDGRRELLAGVTRDDQFGHCVAFGVGGIFTEALNDVTYRLAPINQPEALEMGTDLKSRIFLGEYRGMPAVNREAVAFILTVLGQLPFVHPEIGEIDLNPILICDADPVVVDAVILLRQC